MPKLTSKTDGNRSVSPAGYELYSVSITLNNGNVSRIDELVQTIEIVESLQTSLFKSLCDYSMDLII